MKRIEMHRALVVGSVVAAVLAGMSVTGCAGVDLTSPPAAVSTSTAPAQAATSPASDATSATAAGGAATATAGGTGTTTVPKPGVTKQPDGQSVVYGTLMHSDLEGGIYIIVDSMPGAAASKAKTLVVVADPERFPFASMKGSYVRADGFIGTAVTSSNMAGPQLIVRAVKVVQAGTP